MKQVLTVGVAAWLAVVAVAAAETHWEIQAVDANGLGTHPKVGADPDDPANRVVVEGIALNAPSELSNLSMWWQLYVQGEGDDHAGTAAWSGIFFQWDLYPEPFLLTNIAPGDRVRLTGFIENHLGKINITERHSDEPAYNFLVEILEPGVGMPEPETPSSLAACLGFDVTRLTGGEWYQSRWVRLRGVRADSGTWAGGQHVWVTDDDGVTMFPLYLTSTANWNTTPQPLGPFDAIGVFDQEAGLGTPMNPPYTSGYRLWVTNTNGIVPWPCTGDADEDGDVDLTDFGTFSSCFNGPNRAPAADDCDGMDFDMDDDVDLTDFGMFSSCFNGPNRPAPAACYTAP
ncbi:MAG: hypothetical protein JXA69_03235 [Phycisphaerae bacterium]|nr:hypothetical protein [Phycisphaerae bacterium]